VRTTYHLVECDVFFLWNAYALCLCFVIDDACKYPIRHVRKKSPAVTKIQQQQQLFIKAKGSAAAEKAYNVAYY